jgi:hypothetical protein
MNPGAVREMQTAPFCRDDHVAGQGQLKSSTKTSAMNGSDGDKWRGIDHVQNGVDAFQKGAHACGALFRRDPPRSRTVREVTTAENGMRACEKSAPQACAPFWNASTPF